MVGVGRFVREDDPDAAEAAITVVDDWQGRGLSGELLRRLVSRAREEDFHHFRAWVLRDNPKAVRVLRRLGDTTSTGQGTAVQLDIALAEPEQLEGPITELVRAAAQGALAPPLSLWRRVSSVLRVGLEGRTEPWPGAGGLGDAIVVGADRSADGRRALRYAIGLAQALDAPLHAVAAYRPLLEPRGRADELLRGIEASLRDSPVDAQVHLRLGDPAEALIEIAEDTRARTIVIGPGGGGARRYLVGSTADKVTRHAPSNVLIVRAPPARDA
jgi:nucleotide-binding universal stress UspA family protein